VFARGAFASAAVLVASACASTPPTTGEIPALTAAPGDAQRGRAIVADRRVGLCLLCHSAPISEERFQGNLAPSLEGAATRWTQAQLRLRVADSRSLNPESIMPSYIKADGFTQVGAAWAGKSILSPQQIEDVVAYLETLK
jgi:sulfur-oxidizing protein SoxX